MLNTYSINSSSESPPLSYVVIRFITSLGKNLIVKWSRRRHCLFFSFFLSPSPSPSSSSSASLQPIIVVLLMYNLIALWRERKREDEGRIIKVAYRFFIIIVYLKITWTRESKCRTLLLAVIIGIKFFEIAPIHTRVRARTNIEETWTHTVLFFLFRIAEVHDDDDDDQNHFKFFFLSLSLLFHTCRPLIWYKRTKLFSCSVDWNRRLWFPKVSLYSSMVIDAEDEDMIYLYPLGDLLFTHQLCFLLDSSNS